MREMDEELLVYKKKQEEKTEEILSEVRGQKTFEEFEEGSDDALRTVYSPEELELREKMSGFSTTFYNKWYDFEDSSSSILYLTKMRHDKTQKDKASNTNNELYNAARNMSCVAENFRMDTREIGTGVAIDAVLRLYTASTSYYDAHRGYQFYDSSKTRKKNAALFRDQASSFIKTLVSKKDEEAITGLGEFDVPMKSEKKKIIAEMDEAKEAIMDFNKHIAADSVAMSPEEIMAEKLTIYRTYDKQIRLYRHMVPEAERTHNKQLIISDYENLLRMEKVIDIKNKMGLKQEKTIGDMAQKQVETEDEREHRESLRFRDKNEGLSDDQVAGIDAIDKWLIRNFNNGGLGGGVVGSLKNTHGDFVSAILSKSKRERLHMYYLVESNHRKNPSMLDVGASQELYVPDLEAFKGRMLANKWKIYARFTGGYTYMQKLSEAFQATEEYRDEIIAAGNLHMQVEDKKEDKDTSPEEKLYQERLGIYKEFYQKLNDYYAFLKSAKKTQKGSSKKDMEEEAKVYAESVEGDLKNLIAKDAEIMGRAQTLFGKDESVADKVNSRYYSNLSETRGIVDMNGTIASVPAGINSAMNATRKEYFGFLCGWSWGMDDETWEDFHLYTGTISDSFAAVAGAVAAVSSCITLVSSGKQMTGGEISEKIFTGLKGLADATKSGFSVYDNIINGGAYLEKATSKVQMLTAASAVLDTGLAVSKVVSVTKQCKSAKSAGKYFDGKHKANEGKELSKEEKKKEKYEKNMLKLSEKVIARDKTAAKFQCAKAGLGLIAVTVPGLGSVCAVVKGVVGIVGAIKDITRLGELRNSMFDNYFNMDGLTEEVIKLKRERGLPSWGQLDDSPQQLRESLRKRVAAAAGFCDMRAAADHIGGLFSKFIHNALFGTDTVSGEERKAYIDLLKSFNLPFDEKKQIPSQQVIFRKMTGC